LSCQNVELNFVKLGEKLRGVLDVSRFVSFPAKRHRRQERAIGFDKKLTERDHTGRVTKILCLLESYVSRE
jgi:hypothetical protein